MLILWRSIMHYFLLFFTVFTTVLFGETIGNVEYSFPGSLDQWELINEVKDEEMTGVLYSRMSDIGAEFFGASADRLPANLPDEAALVEGLQLAYPEQTISVNIVETESQSVIFEWSISDESQPIVQGFGRVISTDRGNVALTYISAQMENIDASRTIWVKALKEAKILK